MYSTRGIEAIATVTELRSRTSALIDQAAGLETGIMIQKNNEPEAVLVNYDLYQKIPAEHQSKFEIYDGEVSDPAARPRKGVDAVDVGAEPVIDAPDGQTSVAAEAQATAEAAKNEAKTAKK